jgi:4-amino-4-deoxy-L-arabinose transferase-like glycosyltransferase
VTQLARLSPAARLVGSGWLVWLVVLVVSLVGAALRLRVVGQSLFADELSTYWIVSRQGLGGVVATVHTNAEITPPLYFVLSWLATRIDLTPELLRLPSLLAGVAAVPLTYLLGSRTVGRWPGLVGAALVALSPFMIYYSTEARGYELAIVLVLSSTLALLAAVDGRRIGWWLAYGGCSCAAVYTHYTAVFALAVQLLWLLWTHPGARRAALLANAGAVVAFLPWLTGLVNDLNSPTTKILSALEPFNAHTVRISLEHWSVGYPYGFPATGVRELPGDVALVLLALGIVLGVAGLAAGTGGRWRWSPDRGLVLVVTLALSAPVGEALASAVGTDVFGTRNLAVSWPAAALALAALLAAAGPRLRFVAVGLALASFAIGAAKMVESRFQRPDYQAAARFIDRSASPGDVVIDGAVAFATPGPLTGLDVTLGRRHRVLRAGGPQERDHPFGRDDRIIPVDKVARRAAAAAAGRRIFLVTSFPIFPANNEAVERALGARYRRIETRTYPGALELAVRVYDRRASPRG